MKRLLLAASCAVAGLMIGGCASEQQNYEPNDSTQLSYPNDPAGVMIYTNTVGPENQARGLYQEPYAGPYHNATPADPFPDEKP